MKAHYLSFSATILLAAFAGCQKPCTKTTQEATSWGDTIYTHRMYPNCNDTLNYYEKNLRSDSTIISEGSFVNGKKNGDWTYSGYQDQVKTYQNGLKVAVRTYRKDGSLEQEEILNADSLFEVRSYFRNGNLESEDFQNLEGYLTGHGILYDSTGRKLAEGDHIAEDVLGDTVYIENPNPPHDLQQTIITENGGKHGPWLYYDFDGNVIDTIQFNRGKAVWNADVVGKWKLDKIVSKGTENSGEEVLMAIPDLVGYEFTADGKLGAFNSKNVTSNWGTYATDSNGADLYVFDNQRVAHRIFLLGVEKESLKFAIGSSVFYLTRVS